ncbi:putative electron transport protein YccM [Pelotomaculum schinkii]|uniref:Putative electron transport protein YccM n=1 Tax=Pelotomaculum schinkii TaxID=78350 RepID=A0A4Y7REA6_9FIRM|nr:4Fe-4S dicluster domain-containing protein [Pelotomaculum schinkii]TEB07348.1 putative electron transport protein YccM [Pelotomaculum schinkii]
MVAVKKFIHDWFWIVLIAFCSTICPMGTMSYYVASIEALKTKINHVTFNVDSCKGCNLCSKDCPVGINVLDHKEQGQILDADCLKCNVCVEKCPKKLLSAA